LFSTHNRQFEYIKTDWYIHENKVKKGEIKENTVLAQCAIKIKGYIDKLNTADNISDWTAKEVVNFLSAEIP